MRINVKKAKLNKYLNSIFAPLSDLPVGYLSFKTAYIFWNVAICFPLLIWLDQEKLEFRVQIRNNCGVQLRLIHF